MIQIRKLIIRIFVVCFLALLCIFFIIFWCVYDQSSIKYLVYVSQWTEMKVSTLYSPHMYIITYTIQSETGYSGHVFTKIYAFVVFWMREELVANVTVQIAMDWRSPQVGVFDQRLSNCLPAVCILYFSLSFWITNSINTLHHYYSVDLILGKRITILSRISF